MKITMRDVGRIFRILSRTGDGTAPKENSINEIKRQSVRGGTVSGPGSAMDKTMKYKYKPLVSDSTVKKQEMDFLSRAVSTAAKKSGLFLEIGTRCGGSAKVIIDQIVKSNIRNQSLICLDPYGNIPYFGGELKLQDVDYTNEMRKHAQKDLFDYVLDKDIDLHFLIMEDKEYFKRFSDGYPIYCDGKKSIQNKYSFVYYDGPHTSSVVKREMRFFIPRLSKGGVFVFDDITRYEHNAIERGLFKAGFRILEKLETKCAYVHS